MREYTPKKVSIWLSAESQRVIGDRNRSGTINAMIERVGAVANDEFFVPPVMYAGSDEEFLMNSFGLLPKKVNGKSNPEAIKVITQFSTRVGCSYADAIILLEQIESGKL